MKNFSARNNLEDSSSSGISSFSKEPVRELKILTIGNSFADSVFDSLQKIAASDPACKVMMDKANIGGCSLEKHWNGHQEGLKPYSDGKSLEDMLKKEKWDIVTIQQASHFSWKKDTYQPYADRIISLIRKDAPTAEIVIQQTWSYNACDPRIAPGGDWGFDQNQMYEKLTQCYLDLAKQYHFRIIPSGYAVQTYRKALGKKLQEPDPASFKELKAGEIPFNPDVVGNFRWNIDEKTGERVFSPDCIHLNPNGEYLQGLVWYGFFFQKDPNAVAYMPADMSPDEAALLKQCASQAIREFPGPGF